MVRLRRRRPWVRKDSEPGAHRHVRPVDRLRYRASAGAEGASGNGRRARTEQKELSARIEANAPAQAALNEGIDLYNKGAFTAAIKHLTDADVIWSGDKAVQVEAYKYLAFSYCVTSRQTLCKQQLEKALTLDPGFELGRGEKGHPLWGPVFERAKKARQVRGCHCFCNMYRTMNARSLSALAGRPTSRIRVESSKGTVHAG